MTDTHLRPRGFRLSIRAALAGFLLFGGVQEMVVSARDPIAAGVAVLANWLIGRLKHDAFRLREPSVSWLTSGFEVVLGLIFMTVAISIGAKIRSSRTSATAGGDRPEPQHS